MEDVDSQKRVIRNMIRLYCRKKHGGESICEDCDALLVYAVNKLSKCPFKDEKPVCSDCKIHCYKPEMRDKVREVMRFSGPRMLFYHPKDFFIHIKRKRR